MGFFDTHALAEDVLNSYTSGMDSVRFGRALGFGARQAAKALLSAADAAASPNPSGKQQPAGSTRAARSGAALGQKAAQTTTQVRQTKEGLSRGSKRFGEAVWGPFTKLSGVLGLELAGVFFGLFFLTAMNYGWRLLVKMRGMGLNESEHRNLMFSGAIALVFGYFCVSSFVRASRRQHRR